VARAGVLYPLERAFLYTFKPELIPFDQVDKVHFERQGAKTNAPLTRTFDLTVTIRPDSPMKQKTFEFRCASGGCGAAVHALHALPAFMRHAASGLCAQ
jgi:Histone chaperone Rttp106-like